MQAGRALCFVLFVGCVALYGGSDQDESPQALPPVLRNMDPEPSAIVRLPGPAPAPAITAPAVPSASTTPNSDDPPRPLLHHIYPASFEQDSAAFCQGLIGQWTESDARFLLGEPVRHRPAFDDNGASNGTIYAFSDPTSRYKEIELDFDAADGTLRSVFIYPHNLTWQEARHRWGTNVNETSANNGRRFYSYMDRRLDVLVDRTGKVISFGLY